MVTDSKVLSSVQVEIPNVSRAHLKSPILGIARSREQVDREPLHIRPRIGVAGNCVTDSRA